MLVRSEVEIAMGTSEVEQLQARWAAGHYPTVGDLWASVGQSLAAELDERIGLDGRALLDVACGHGTTALAAARHGARVTAVDLTPELLAEARRRADAEQLEVDLRQCDFHHLPLPDDAVEVVTSTFGVFLATRPTEVAAELARVLRPDGALAVTAWTRDAPFHDLVDVIVEVGDVDRDELLADRPDSALWAEADGLEELTAATDLVVEEVRQAEVLLSVTGVDELIALFDRASGPWIQTREQLTTQGIAWDEVLMALRPRWEDRMHADGFAMPYARSLLRHR